MNDVISFEEFLERQNNFYLHFCLNWVGNIYRERELYKKFATENPILNQKLLIEM